MELPAKSHVITRRPSQTVESLEELKSHPTISQDWTNQDTVENNRLVALQKKLDVDVAPRSEYTTRPPSINVTPHLAAHGSSRPKRAHSYLQQSHRQDDLRSLGPDPGILYGDDHNSLPAPKKAKNTDGLNTLSRQADPRLKIQSHRPFPNEYSHQPPESRRQSPQKSIETEDLDNNILVQQLDSDLEKLKKENVYLKSRLREPLPRLQVVYRVSRGRHRSEGFDGHDRDETVIDMYLDKPQLLKGDKGMASLQGHLPIFRLDSYLERHPKISVIVFQDTYDRNPETEAEDEVLEVSWSESIFVTSRKLMKTLKQFGRKFSSSLGCSIGLDLTGSKAILPAPYLPFYHYSENMKEYAADLPSEEVQEWNLLVKYIDDNYGDQYREVGKMLEEGTISPRFIPYLIKDGDTIVRRDSHGHSAYLATSQPIQNVPRNKRQNNGLAQHPGVSSGRHMDVKDSLNTDNLDGTVDGMSDSSSETQEWEIGTEFWLFDGNFEKRRGTTVLKISGRRDELLAIKDLEIYPIQFADPDLVSNMKNTGLEFWKSRSRRYVSYRSGRAEIDTKSSKPRYMIDPATYKKLHPKAVFVAPLRDDLGPERMSAEEPPAGPFLLLLPRTINGFNMQNKKWEELEVARISEVSWNKEAFESLVVEPTTKTLIKALVMQQLEKEKGTDLIAGKGQGLIVLLHGGPGTGKTFTAETVAEIAEKPLYRVTCGDLGTEPTEVEKYLESVLYLGKVWDCVVLLDEADVYLEERSMESLPRNALVSVFLRVLEYYEGILILTSNRVGTFDESFKSRIQLALHYEKLKLNDRRTIWENFIRRLQKLEEVGIDFDDINRHMDDLARNELNGRQIRNAITTARQFARHQEKDLDYADLQQVIKIALKFDKHTMEMQGGMNDDARKREDGIRP